MKKCASFDDVLVVPGFSDITSRSEIDLSSRLGSLEMTLPVISSPMDTVTESQMASTISFLGGLGIIHRYNSPAEQALLVADAFGSAKRDQTPNIGFAVGVGEDMIERAQRCVRAGASLICIDVAHGHHALVRHALKTLRNTFGDPVHIMAGNVATKEGYEDLASWGADSVRVGIGGGSICSTRIQTGHGVPTLQSVIDCASSELSGTVPIIADGGIKNSGDIVKAIAAGADFAMLGSLLSGTDQSPGEKIQRGDNLYKEYRGMASERAQVNWRGRVASREGVAALVPYKGSVEDIIESLVSGIRSGLSYSGCRTISEFHSKASMIFQTSSGFSESNTHVLSRGIKI